MTSGVARGRPVIFYNRKYSIKTLRILEAKHAVWNIHINQLVKKKKKKRKLSLQYMDADLNELEPFK